MSCLPCSSGIWESSTDIFLLRWAHSPSCNTFPSSIWRLEAVMLENIQRLRVTTPVISPGEFSKQRGVAGQQVSCSGNSSQGPGLQLQLSSKGALISPVLWKHSVLPGCGSAGSRNQAAENADPISLFLTWLTRYVTNTRYAAGFFSFPQEMRTDTIYSSRQSVILC